MGSEIEITEKLEDVMEVSVSPSVVVEDGEPCVSPREELGNCVSNREDDVLQMEGVAGVHDNGVGTSGNCEELEVDVVGNGFCDDGDERVVGRESQDDATECSSSFGCTDSGSGPAEALGDMEVESLVHDDVNTIGFDGCSDLFRARKKKLTDHWRNYVRPIMWRCKWVELKVREMQSQAAKYAKALAECDQRKHCELEKLSTEDNAVKAAPYISQNRSVKLMKRKKRKRVEETVDLTSYTDGHNLFSHFVTKKPGADIAYLNNDHCRAGNNFSGDGEFSFNDELPSLHFNDSDAFESVLRKIEEAQVHVRQLKVRMDKVVKDNAGKFTSDIVSSAPRNRSTSFGSNSAPSYVNDEPGPSRSMPPTSSQWPVMPIIKGSIPEKVGLPDMVKTIDGTKIRGKCNKVDKGIQICSRPVKQECNITEDVHVTAPAELSSGPVRKTEIVEHVADPNTPQDQAAVKMQSSSSKTSFPENKRKRGSRKARTDRWSKRSSEG